MPTFATKYKTKQNKSTSTSTAEADGSVIRFAGTVFGQRAKNRTNTNDNHIIVLMEEKLITMHPEGNINVWTKFHGINPTVEILKTQKVHWTIRELNSVCSTCIC